MAKAGGDVRFYGSRAAAVGRGPRSEAASEQWALWLEGRVYFVLPSQRRELRILQRFWKSIGICRSFERLFLVAVSIAAMVGDPSWWFFLIMTEWCHVS